jgi:hypothetical protein
VAKARRKSTPTFAGKGVFAADARVYGWVDKTDWKKRGRKSPKGEYQMEAQRRLKAGEVAPGTSHKAFANDLRVWFKDTFPNIPDKKLPAALTIERNTRDVWQQYRG